MPSVKGTRLWYKMWLYPNSSFVVLQFKQDTMLGWEKRLCMLIIRDRRALPIKWIEGPGAIPFSNLQQQEWRISLWAVLLQLAGDQVLNK